MESVLSSIPHRVTVVAVTKTFPFSVVEKAYRSGIRHIGENRVEEAERKIEEAKNSGLDDVIWHMVGHVQSRKVKRIAALFDWVDSVDSEKVAEALDREAGALGKKLSILLEVNLSGEANKYGFDLFGWTSDRGKLDLFVGEVQKIMQCSHLTVSGLMTMPPIVTNLEHNKALFRSVRQLSETIRAQIPSFGAQLSMGTSQDYQVAIEEGATQIRLGEALFGKRPIS